MSFGPKPRTSTRGLKGRRSPARVKPRESVAPRRPRAPGRGAGGGSRGPSGRRRSGVCHGPRVSPGAGLLRPFRPMEIGSDCVRIPSVSALAGCCETGDSPLLRSRLTMRIPGKRISRVRWIHTDRYVVAVEVEMVIPPDGPSEPCYESETVQVLREVEERGAAWRRGLVEATRESVPSGRCRVIPRRQSSPGQKSEVRMEPVVESLAGTGRDVTASSESIMLTNRIVRHSSVLLVLGLLFADGRGGRERPLLCPATI